jgi:hypothetical protein
MDSVALTLTLLLTAVISTHCITAEPPHCWRLAASTFGLILIPPTHPAARLRWRLRNVVSRALHAAGLYAAPGSEPGLPASEEAGPKRAAGGGEEQQRPALAEFVVKPRARQTLPYYRYSSGTPGSRYRPFGPGYFLRRTQKAAGPRPPLPLFAFCGAKAAARMALRAVF